MHSSTRRWIVGLVSAAIAVPLSWVMLIGALSGNWWAIGGFTFAISMSIVTMLLAETPEKDPDDARPKRSTR